MCDVWSFCTCDVWSLYTLLLSKSLSILQLTLFLSLVTLQGKSTSIPCAKTHLEMFCWYLPWNSKIITLLYKCLSLIFLVQEQRSGFPVWGSLQKIEKAKVEKGSNFLVQPSRLGASVVATNFNYQQELKQVESAVNLDGSVSEFEKLFTMSLFRNSTFALILELWQFNPLFFWYWVLSLNTWWLQYSIGLWEKYVDWFRFGNAG